MTRSFSSSVCRQKGSIPSGADSSRRRPPPRQASTRSSSSFRLIALFAIDAVDNDEKRRNRGLPRPEALQEFLISAMLPGIETRASGGLNWAAGHQDDLADVAPAADLHEVFLRTKPDASQNRTGDVARRVPVRQKPVQAGASRRSVDESDDDFGSTKGRDDMMSARIILTMAVWDTCSILSPGQIASHWEHCEYRKNWPRRFRRPMPSTGSNSRGRPKVVTLDFNFRPDVGQQAWRYVVRLDPAVRKPARKRGECRRQSCRYPAGTWLPLQGSL